MKLQYHKHHSRTSRYYEKGETPARYGIARQLDDGTYEFMCDYGNWHENFANCWCDPPHHYLRRSETNRQVEEGAFIVNFNKPSSPKPKSLRY